ncbi:hypothetical protein ABPG72_015245 [Tetrahymena utriculariae]
MTIKFENMQNQLKRVQLKSMINYNIMKKQKINIKKLIKKIDQTNTQTNKQLNKQINNLLNQHQQSTHLTNQIAQNYLKLLFVETAKKHANKLKKYQQELNQKKILKGFILFQFGLNII